MLEILIWAAVIPSVILIFLVLKHDKVESEPVGLLIKLFILGALTTLPAGLLESFGEQGIMAINRSSDMQTLLMFLICVPLVEEGLKYLVLMTTWKNEAFNFTFDGVVYAVIVSLGFATLENMLYVLNYMSLQVAVMRGILSVPLHCTCGIFMGYFYGMARNHKARGEQGRSVVDRVLALLIPLLIHGIYDFALSIESDAVSVAGLGFTVVVFILAVMQGRWSSRQDSHIAGTDVPMAQPVRYYPVQPQHQQAPVQPPYQAQPQYQYQYPQQPPYQQVPVQPPYQYPQQAPYQQAPAQPQQPVQPPYPYPQQTAYQQAPAQQQYPVQGQYPPQQPAGGSPEPGPQKPRG